jgi:hypothetical protein
MSTPEARLAALELLVEQLILERCVATDDPVGTAESARERLAELAQRDMSGRITPEIAQALDERMRNIVDRTRGHVGSIISRHVDFTDV